MATSTSTRPTTRQSARFSRTTKPAKRVVEEVSDSEEERERQREIAEKSSSKVMRTPTKKRKTSSSGNDEQDDGNASQKSHVQITVTPVKEALTLAYPNYLPTPPITPTTSSASTNSTPSSSSSSSSGSSSNIYARARALLRLSAHDQQSSASSELVGRNVERSQLEAFLKTNLATLYTPAELEDVASSCSSKALYVSGSPGTGKTALLQNILGRLESRLDASTSLAFLNCTTIQRSDDIWERLAEELGFSAVGKGKKRWDQNAFESALQASKKQFLVVLDEIDHLLAGTSGVLSQLFTLALDPSSSLVLIGIANALDLTQRHLSLFSSEGQADLQPDLLHFRPFQSDEMVAIVKNRLMTLHNASSDDQTRPLPVVAPAALELAAKKVAAVTGDLRSFLSLIRKAVEIFEAEQRKKLEASDAASPTPKSNAGRGRKRNLDEYTDVLADFDAATAPKLSPAHILKATRLVTLHSASTTVSPAGGASTGSSLSAVAQSSSAILESKIQDLNLHQRLALLGFAIAQAQREADVSLPWSTSASSKSASMKPNELHAVYRGLLEKEDLLHPVGISEFNDLVSGLHTRGLVGLESDYITSPKRSKSGSTLAVPESAPMLRRTSSSSSASTSRSRSPSPSAAQTPLLLLYTVKELNVCLRSTKPVEAAGICSRILDKEEKRIRRIKTVKQQEEARKVATKDAPMEGFSGNGLQEDVKYVGKRDRRGRAHAEDEDGEDNDETKNGNESDED